MENIFDKKEKKFTHIVIPTELARKLKENKGSYTQIIKQLLNISIDKRVIERLNQIEDDILELQDKLIKIVQLNKLRC